MRDSHQISAVSDDLGQDFGGNPDGKRIGIGADRFVNDSQNCGGILCVYVCVRECVHVCVGRGFEGGEE